MKRKNPNRIFSVLGYVALFVTIAVIIMVALLVYDLADRALNGNDALIAVVMLTVIIFLALICTLADGIRRKILVKGPVEKILEATQKIASGDFSVRMEPIHAFGRYNEYDHIMENINKMSAELAKTEVLHTDFVSNVSHELKTPLAIIQNYSMAIQSGALDKETHDKYANVLAMTAKRLTDLVTNILKLNRLENQEIAPVREEIRLNEILEQALLRYEERIEEKSLELACDLQPVTVHSDPAYLEIVWNNLISNAVKFTEPEGRIFITLGTENGNAVVKVEDSGCGIPKEIGERIFDKFYQGDTSHAQEGNGLGLALVKKVIDVLGGEISVESEVGKGSIFTVKLRGENQ